MTEKANEHMKKTNIAILAAAALLCVQGVRAAGMDIDFDGVTRAGAHAGGDLSSFLEADLIPDVRYGTIPSVPDPTCVDGCGGGGSGSNDEWPVPIPGPNSGPINMYEPFVAAVCINAGSVSQNCFHETGDQAAARLAKMASKKFIHAMAQQPLKLAFPDVMSRAKVFEALIKMEIKMMELLQQQFAADLDAMVPFAGMTQAQKEERMRIIAFDQKVIRKWSQAARIEASNLQNWEEVKANVYMFNGGPAYQQLGQTLLGKEWFH